MPSLVLQKNESIFDRAGERVVTEQDLFNSGSSESILKFCSTKEFIDFILFTRSETVSEKRLFGANMNGRVVDIDNFVRKLSFNLPIKLYKVLTLSCSSCAGLLHVVNEREMRSRVCSSKEGTLKDASLLLNRNGAGAREISPTNARSTKKNTEVQERDNIPLRIEDRGMFKKLGVMEVFTCLSATNKVANGLSTSLDTLQRAVKDLDDGMADHEVG